MKISFSVKPSVFLLVMLLALLHVVPRARCETETAISLPTDKHARWFYDAVEKPVLAEEVSQCEPIGVGDPESGMLDLQIGLPAFESPVDLYLGFRSESTGSILFFITPEGTVYEVTGALDPSMAWMSNVDTEVIQSVFTIVPPEALTIGEHSWYLTVTPAGTLDAWYTWGTTFEIPVPRPEGWTAESHGDSVDPNYDVVFPQDKVNRIEMYITPEDWEAMHKFEIRESGERKPAYRPCTLKFEDKSWWQVGVRFKGNSSLGGLWIGQQPDKKPFRLDFDKFEDDYPEIRNQRFYGFDDISLGNNWSDDSMVREKVAHDVFREAGMVASQTSFYRVYVDFGEGLKYFGLYTNAEVPREPMLEAQFGNSSGNLYKAVMYGPPWAAGASLSIYDPDGFEKKTNIEENDYSDLEMLYNALHAPRDNAGAWRAGLESVLDVEWFLRWLAINTVIQNWDTYGRMAQNYYLYTDPSDGKIRWIPWDYNMAFGFASQCPDISLDDVFAGWPLIRYLIDDPLYQAMYQQFVHDTIEGVYSPARSQQRFSAAHQLIEPYVVGPEGEWPEYTKLRRPQDFYDALTTLLWHPWLRWSVSSQYLAEQGFVPRKVVINEILYNPAPDLGEDYEFVELFNAGTFPIDLSGYSFSSAVTFTFPQYTTILPGEYVVVAEDAALYSGQGYQVFEWESGQLSNGGETLQLKDMWGIEIDHVSYDDDVPWPTSPDGDGPSLSVIDPYQDNYTSQNWMPSAEVGGSPGW